MQRQGEKKEVPHTAECDTVQTLSSAYTDCHIITQLPGCQRYQETSQVYGGE